jgi:hypothetical protein
VKRRHVGPRQTAITLTIDGGRIRIKANVYVESFYAALKARFWSRSYDPDSFTWSVAIRDLDELERLACERYDRVTVVEGQDMMRQVKPYSFM